MSQNTTNNPRTFELSQALLDKFKEFCQDSIGYQPRNASEAIQYALLAYSGRKINVGKTQKQHILLIPDSAKRLTVLQTSVRISDALYADLQKIATKLNVTVQEMPALIMVDLLTKNDLPLHALRIPGSKRDKRMQEAITKVLGNRHYDASVEPCGGALEIHLNFKVADTEIVCDIDPEKVNFYQIIQTHHQTFVARILSYPVNPATFNMIKESKPANKIDKAVRYFYLTLHSTRNNRTDYHKISLREYWNAIAATYALHARLQNTHIYQCDLFKTLECKNLPEGRTLLIVDPPYLETKAYSHNLTYADHCKLSKRLLHLHQKNGHDFVYFCRVTARHDHKDDAAKQAKKVQNDLIMKGQIDDMYYGHGLFFIDIPLDNGVIERIIASFRFEGATLYGKGVR